MIRLRHAILTVIIGAVAAGSATAQSVTFDINRVQLAYTSADVIAAGQSISGLSEKSIWFFNNTATPLEGLSFTFPAYDYWDGWADSPSNVQFNPTAKTVTTQRLDPLPAYSGYSLGVDTSNPSWQRNSEIGISRSVNTTLITSDSQTVHLTVTLDVPAGGLTGYDDLHMNIGAPWNLPDGVDVAINTATSTAPWGFYVTDDSVFYTRPGGASASSLSGTYTFELDLDVTRSGDYSQANYGNMRYKPEVGTRYDARQMLSPITASQVTMPGAAVTGKIDSPAAVTWNTGLSGDMRETIMGGYVGQAGASVELGGVFLLKFKGEDVTGDTHYSFMCEVEAQGVTRATITTPGGGATYEVPVAIDGDQLEINLDVQAATDAELVAKGFTNGNYVLTLYDDADNPTVVPLTLAGDYPTAQPNITTDLVDPDDLTVAWDAAPGDVTDIHANLYTPGNDDEFESFFDAAATSYAVGPIDPTVGYEAGVAFLNGTLGEINGVMTILGYVNETYKILNVENPVVGDVDGDGMVDDSDFAILASFFGNLEGMALAQGDLDGDFAVDDSDFAILAANFGTGTPGSADAEAVPEPASLLAMSLAGIALSRRRQR